MQFDGGRLQSSRVCYSFCRKRHNRFSKHQQQIQCQVLSESFPGGRRGSLLHQTARNDVVQAQGGDILMFTEIKEQIRIFQNFVKHFF